MKVIIFGTGAYYQKRKEHFDVVEKVAFIDNNVEKQNTDFEGVPILSPEMAINLKYDYVCVMSSLYTVEMVKQLILLGYDSNKIIGYGAYTKLVKRIINEGSMQIYYKNLPGNVCGQKGKILLVTHELSLSGAPVVLFYAAEILKKNGYEPVILSPKDGKLREVIISKGITVVIEPLITGKNAYLYEWMSGFELVIICTFTFGEFVGELADFPKPVLWWLHEGEEVYSAWWSKAKPERIGRNVSIYAGGGHALTTYQKYFGNDDCKMLLYGIPNENINDKQGYVRRHKGVVFAVVAVLQPRKGQDIFVEAIKRMSDGDKENAEFWIVGPDPGIYQEFVEKLYKAIETEPKIKMVGEWPMERLMEEYINIDVLVCPSRDDPMPVVVPEAMMFYKPCIVSKGAGTVGYIEDRCNGLVCECNAESLAEQMAWIMNHQDSLERIGIEGPRLYERVFSTEAFEKNLLKIIYEKVGENYEQDRE